MFHQPRVFILALSLLAGTVLPAASQGANKDTINLVGTWKGTGYAVHIGATPYRPGDGAGVKFPDNGIEFTYVISQQKGNRFSGEMSGGAAKETIIGAIQPDNRGGIMLDNDGHNTFVLIDPNAMDVCYNHQTPASKLVACLRVTKQR